MKKQTLFGLAILIALSYLLFSCNNEVKNNDTVKTDSVKVVADSLVKAVDTVNVK